MKDFVFISGNQHKVEYLTKWLGKSVEHKKLDLEEIQSLDPRIVIEDKARRAYEMADGASVLVEDVSLTLPALGGLPGTLIKWFLQELGAEGICTMLQPCEDKRAVASILYGLYDGSTLHTFDGETRGSITSEPHFNSNNTWQNGRTWNSIFIPDGETRTYSEMTDDEVATYSHRGKAVAKLKAYLEG